MSKFKIKGRDCYLNNEDLDDLRESTRTDSKRNKQRKQKNLERGENEFFSNIRKSKRSI